MISFDTNVLVYATAALADDRASRAHDLLARVMRATASILPVRSCHSRRAGYFRRHFGRSGAPPYVKMAGVTPVKLLDEVRERLAALLQID
jgi:hypothetical protein